MGNIKTCPSAIMMSTWYWPPLSSTISTAASTIGAKDVGPAIDHNNKVREPRASLQHPEPWEIAAVIPYVS
jgi:hypothetical protein